MAGMGTLLLAGLVAGTVLATRGAEAAAGGGENPVVLELFTSQGCSSCPPADRLLSRLVAESEAGGTPVIGLAFHVDYWNYIGWEDPFSSAQWSARQRKYAEALRASSVYTPQLVINGSRELVGSRETQVRQEIAEAAAQPAAARVSVAVGTPRGGKVPVTVSAEVLRASKQPWVVMVALVEHGLVTPVKAGENNGRELHNDAVVRSLVEAARLPGAAGSRWQGEVELALEGSPAGRRLGVVAFVQEARSLEVKGAAVHWLAPPP